MITKLKKSEVAREIILQFPKATTWGLAKKLSKEYPDVFLTVESARSAVRYVRGELGISAENSSDPITRESKPLNAFADLPEGITSLNDLKPYQINGTATIGVLNDVHIPYHDKGALILALEYLKGQKITHLLLNGDICDFYTISRWETDPRQRNLAGEIQTSRLFLKLVREYFPNTEILFKEGNHENRWTRYLSVRAPELLGMQEFELPQVLQFQNFGITHVSSSQFVQTNGLNIVHGHEWVSGISAPVNPARGQYLRAKEACIVGHYHRTSSHTEKTMSGKVIASWSIGCLCNLKPDYARFNNWNQGLGVVMLDGSSYYVSNLKIVDGRIFP